MSRVVMVESQGVRCALPADHVVRVGGQESAAPLLRLFASRPQSSTERYLTVSTPSGPRTLPCEAAYFGTLSDQELMPLPRLLHEDLQAAHIVGVAHTKQGFVWLIDTMRCGEQSHESE